MVKDERFALTGDFDSEEDNLGEQLGEVSGSDDLSVSELGEGEDAEAAGQTAAERTAGEASTSEQGMEPGGEDPDGEVEKAGKSKKVLSEEKLKRIKDVYDK